MDDLEVCGAIGALLALLGCSQHPEVPVRSAEYYRAHVAEWERRVWDCTNEPPTVDRKTDCVNALLVLRRANPLGSNPAAATSRLPDARN